MSAPWRSYRLIPEDVLFFRDGKPATMGDDHYLRSIFPPYPSTLYGLARTQCMLDAGCDLGQVTEHWWPAELSSELRSVIGEWNAYGSLRLRGPWILDGDEILLPAPHDLLVIASRAQDGPRTVNEVFRLVPDATRERRDWSHEKAVMNWDDRDETKEPEPVSGWFLKMSGVKRWADGGKPLPDDFVDSAALWSVEMRTGLGLQTDRRVSKDSMLYTFGFIRLERGVSIGFELSGGEIQSDRHARLGGEGRLAWLTKGPSLTAALDAFPQDGAVVALLTPGIYENGSSPNDQVTAAVVSDAVRVGGWDLARREPKVLYRAAPAGSVYYTAGQPVEQLQSKQEQEGFGLLLRGNVPRR